jgi:hypothetical protein
LDRRGASIFLIPMFAAMALLFPAARRGPSDPPSPLRGSPNLKNTNPGQSEGAKGWSRGRKAVRTFFGYPPNLGEASKWNQDRNPLKQAKLDFLIVTIPDPIDSGLPYVFDRYMASLQGALQTEPYLLSRFDLPWQDCFAGDGEQNETEAKGADQKDDKEKKKTDCNNKRYRSEPGFMLLTNPNGASDRSVQSNESPDKSKSDLLLVYLVGETPKIGVNKRALRAALNEISWFCGWDGDIDHDDIKEISKQSSACATNPMPTAASGTGPGHELEDADADVTTGVRILGPSYSGSAQSLDLALAYWLDSVEPKTPKVRILSGTATAIAIPDDSNPCDAAADFYQTRRRLLAPCRQTSGEKQIDREPAVQTGRNEGGFIFRSLKIHDDQSRAMFCRYLQSTSVHLPVRTAMLTENGTVYGNGPASRIAQPQNSNSAVVSKPKDPCDGIVEETIIPYPLNVSQLRAASEKQKQSEGESSPQPQISSKALPLKKALASDSQRRDILPFSDAGSVTAEQIMSSLLSTISHEHYNYIGILATDSRDTMFLAEEVHEHSPGSILYTYNTELLYLHDEINSNMRGMLMVGTYPLAISNQLWSPPWHTRTLLQFPDENSEGMYNAALVLLGQSNHLREYGLPFSLGENDQSQSLTPPVWITVVGRDRLWPVDAYESNGLPGDSAGKESGSAQHANVPGPYTFRLPRAVAEPGTSERSAQNRKDASSLWWRGLYPPHTTILINTYSLLCILFCLHVLLAVRPAKSAAGEPILAAVHSPQPLSSRSGLALYRRESLVYFIPACASLLAFILPLLATLLIPAAILAKLGAPLKPLDSLILDHLGTAISVLFSATSLGFLFYVIFRLLRAILRKLPGERNNKMMATSSDVWGYPVLALFFVLTMALAVLVSWALLANEQSERIRMLFASMRSLDLLSGVSPLVPLFLISLAGFVWSLVSYNRRRLFEPAADYVESQADAIASESFSGFLPLRGLRMGRTRDLEREIRRRIECSPFALKGCTYVVGAIFLGGSFIFFLFVRELEQPALYWFLGISFLLVSAVMWLGVLRFWSVWCEVQRLLKYVASTPLSGACKRFRKTYPTPLKLDLASPVPALAAQAHCIEQVFALHESAKDMVAAQAVLYMAGTGTSGITTSSGSVAATGVTVPYPGLVYISSSSFSQRAKQAEVLLQFAQKAHVEHDQPNTAFFQWACRAPLASVAATVSSIVDGWWSQSQRPSGSVCEMAESFLVGRLVHFLGYVLPQLQHMIAASMVGVLLLLLAVNSYPFPPHDVLVWLNWAVVLAFVAITLGVFIQMNRDPVLSHLNGTTPGKVNWDGEFILRVFTYGVIPIVTLLGAQFPDSIGHILSYFRMGEAIHQ